MKGEEENPNVTRMVVLYLRFTARLSQTELGLAAGLTQSQVSRLESGLGPPSEEVLRRIAAAAAVPWPLVARLRRFAGSFHSALSGEAGRFEEVDPEVLPRSAESSWLLEDLDAAAQRSPGELRREAERFWAHVAGLPAPRRRRAVELSPRASRSWALAETLCHASERAAARSVPEALELADLALRVAQRVESETLRRQAEGYAWAYVGNARRVGNDFAGADAAFAEARALWRDSRAPEAGLLAEWRMCSLEASLRRNQWRFPEALDLLARAQQSAGGAPEAQGVILLKRESVHSHMGDLESALATLAEAAPLLEPGEDARLLLALRFRRVKHLWALKRGEEAAALLPEVRELAGRLGNELDLLRVEWLTARVEAETGRTGEAITHLEEIRRRFADHGLPYDAALASLDLAMLYLEEGRTAEVKTLAREMAETFKSQGIAGEALAALSPFFEAAQRETATVELVRSVIN